MALKQDEGCAVLSLPRAQPLTGLLSSWPTCSTCQAQLGTVDACPGCSSLEESGQSDLFPSGPGEEKVTSEPGARLQVP